MKRYGLGKRNRDNKMMTYTQAISYVLFMIALIISRNLWNQNRKKPAIILATFGALLFVLLQSLAEVLD